MTTDYGKTIHLPKSDFPRRGGLGKKEPIIQARWDKMDLYNKQRAASEGREKFILHVGPPFANGHTHMGHALSFCLKDFITRSHQMLGHDSPLVPGFDCHGLPIEWKVEENFRAEKKNITKDSDPIAFRDACRNFAQGWVDVQSEEFQRIGVFGDFKNPYNTMNKKSEAMISRELHKFLMKDSMYIGLRPIMWSIPEQTALAEAEVEYKDVTSDTIFVSFPIKETKVADIKDAQVVIWTTTPWTLPGNRAIGFGEKYEYVAITVKETEEEEGRTDLTGRKFIIAKDLLDEFLSAADILEHEIFWEGKGADFEGTICQHPLYKKDEYYSFDVPLLAGDFVTTEAGTGFVHIAPGHGDDDYRLGLQHKIEVPNTVGGDGKYMPSVGLFADLEIYTEFGKKGPANKMVTNAINEEKNLIAKGQILHSYPHSWRSGAPVIFRTTPQWFISMETNDLRKKALAEIEKTRFVPARGKNRINAMVEGRGDWCISRQRAWGVPIAIFVNKKSGEPLKDQKVNDRIYDIFEENGSDAWFNTPAQEFLGDKYKIEDYDQVTDIIDVWFESGSTQSFGLEDRPELQYPADVYLEGSDQHRGWFQSSLMVGCATRDQAPYKTIVGHGFVLDEKGYKMAKSGGNGMSPIKVAGEQGADILRLWVAGSDYSSDVRVGKNILKGHIDIYKRIRGTFCYLLGNLNGFDKADKVAYSELSELDQWVLHKLYELDGQVKQAIEEFDFLGMINMLHNFCSQELSSFYLDICKDALYCDSKDDKKRQAILTVLDEVFNHLVHWLSPILCFTTEEAWLVYNGLTFDDMEESIHLRTFPEVAKEWNKPELDVKWNKIQEVRSIVTGAMEVKRAEKVIGSSLAASPKVYIYDKELEELIRSVNFADICITSDIEIIGEAAPQEAFTAEGFDTVAVMVETAAGDKCDRCWKFTKEVGENKDHPTICKRCAEAI